MAVVDKQALTKIAKMLNMGVSERQIGMVFNLTDAQLKTILESSDFLIVQAEVEGADFENAQTMNEGWDGVESLALSRVVEHLSNGMAEPDFALRAATLANKAERRGKHANEPLQVRPAMQTIIHLQANFVARLSSDFKIQERAIEGITQKDSNFLEPSKVKSMFGVTKQVQGENLLSSVQDELDQLLGDSVNA